MMEWHRTELENPGGYWFMLQHKQTAQIVYDFVHVDQTPNGLYHEYIYSDYRLIAWAASVEWADINKGG
jgi:hypothetical protein